MIHDEIRRLYEQFRLLHYTDLFRRIREKDGQLSATEAFATDVIYLLGRPTISQFADTLGISQPNATYKINNLEAKGYVRRDASETDRRTCYVSVGDRFHNYYDSDDTFITDAVEQLRDRYDERELALFEDMLQTLNQTLTQITPGKAGNHS